MTRVTRVNQITEYDAKTITRAGAIFYTIVDRELYFCLGRDAKSNDLTDFGGGRKITESVADGALREAAEESRKVFGAIDAVQIQHNYCVLNTHMMIVFIPIMAACSDIVTMTKYMFSTKKCLEENEVNAKCYNEMSDLEWIPARALLTAMDFLYARVRNLFRNVRFLDLLMHNLYVSLSTIPRPTM